MFAAPGPPGREMLSATSQYAIRVLAFLAREEGDSNSYLSRDLAEMVGAPAQYLSKILVRLTKARILSSVRGARGGYRLIADPSAVHLRRVVEIVDGPVGSSHCLLYDDRPCTGPEKGCKVHTPWCDLQEQLVAFLENTTLADLRFEPPDDCSGCDHDV